MSAQIGISILAWLCVLRGIFVPVYIHLALLWVTNMTTSDLDIRKVIQSLAFWIETSTQYGYRETTLCTVLHFETMDVEKRAVLPQDTRSRLSITGTVAQLLRSVTHAMQPLMNQSNIQLLLVLQGNISFVGSACLPCSGCAIGSVNAQPSHRDGWCGAAAWADDDEWSFDFQLFNLRSLKFLLGLAHDFAELRHMPVCCHCKAT